MKKSKLITCLSAAFVAAMALMSCSSTLKGRKNVILTIDGVPYTADQLFNDQKTPAAAEAKFNAVYKAAIRTNFLKDHPGYEDMDEIKRDTKVKIKELKATAQSNASKNGTSYATEWKKILTENGVSSSSELNDKVEYDFQKEKFENKFYDKNYDRLRKDNPSNPLFPKDPEHPEQNFVDFLTYKQPYHMKHILVKIANLGDNNTDGTITEAEAEKLYTVINELALGKDFKQVSQDNSDDEAAKKKYGSLGIMTRDTSFVDDFKLGTYFYESYYGNSTVGTAKQAFFNGEFTKGAGFYADQIRAFAQDPTTSNPSTEKPLDYQTIGVIPFDAALKLGKKTIDNPTGLGDFEFKDSLLESAGILKEDFKDKYLPRNVIFNKYFNKHNIMVIAPAKSPASIFDYGTDIVEDGNGSRRVVYDKYNCVYDSTVNLTKYKGFDRDEKNTDLIVTNKTDSPTFFNSITDSNGEQHILRDDEGRTVLVFRSGSGGSSSNDDSGYQGIHFVVIQRSPFIESEDDDRLGEKKTSIEDYYTEYYPGQPGGNHPYYGEDKTDYKHTYANYIMQDPEVKNKKERADEVKKELKNCMPNLNTFVYEYLLKANDIHFEENPESIAVRDCITDWIKINRENTKIEKDRNWDNNWQNYYYSLKAKMEEREEVEVDTDNIKSRVVPEYCVTAITDFANHSDHEELRHLFGVGGVFHE